MRVNNVTPVNEVGKYTKKKDSNKSKAKNKSNHKHLYDYCLFKAGQNKSLYLGKYCTLCKKIDNVVLPTISAYVGEHTERRMMTREEVLEQYADLPIYEIKNIWQKCIEE